MSRWEGALLDESKTAALETSGERKVKLCKIIVKKRRDWDGERKKDDCRGGFNCILNYRFGEREQQKHLSPKGVQFSFSAHGEQTPQSTHTMFV